jgi:hypothetical protein
VYVDVSKPRRHRGGRSAAHAGQDVTPPETPGPGEGGHASGRQRASLIAAAVSFGLWTAALIALAVFTANPITLQYAQIDRARLIVEGTFERSEVDARGLIELRVERSWPAGHADATLVIDAGPRLSVKAGQAYLVPLEPIDDGQYGIVPTRVPSAAPVIYPANPRTVAQLNAILNRE